MDHQSGESDLITALQSQLDSLRIRIKELESDNAKLSTLVSTCRCRKTEENIDDGVVGVVGSVKETERLNLEAGKSRKKKGKQKLPDYNLRTEFQFSKRYVALKVMYFGKRFFGFASEGNMDPTVESEIFKALEKTRLIDGDKKDLQYSRCGRTDKGVSSVGQVISLFLRSDQKESEWCYECSAEFVAKEQNEGEIDYVRILNRVLPKDIRIMGWCPASTDFSARFSCLSREYKYFFWRGNLNIVAMENAGKKLIGEHDFRNFCKMDAANVHNYRRRITLFEISPSNERFESDELWAVKIKGTAFLWHQVRCMVAALFLIGQGLESPNVIDALLDIVRTPRKPQYIMAPEIPLVLQSCNFEGLEFMCSSDARQALHAHLEMECRSYKLQAAIFHEALLSCSHVENGDSMLINKTKKKAASYVPLMFRPTEPSYEERRIKLNSRAQE
ncbi:TRNA pseudouridine(38/39) synthase [Actinidia chinensis var. chinensis]|uniref:tRNA pseudouridine(38/39) synthase n=1 Tax=Actinidia chinensis var. chinensis TaxID=1590841 RepID=A0A2R6Q0V9_ACTCC|nr:TRNA pseudouridine(38/39) synthase [Actinidia chinensis var. chinensis]